MEINSSLILPRSVFISISCTECAHILQRDRHVRLCGVEGPEFLRCTRNTFKDTVWELVGRELRNVRGEGGRWREDAAISRQAWRMQQQGPQMTPCETGGVVNDTNSSARTLQRGPDSHLHCQTKRLLLKNGAHIVI